MCNLSRRRALWKRLPSCTCRKRAFFASLSLSRTFKTAAVLIISVALCGVGNIHQSLQNSFFGESSLLGKQEAPLQPQNNEECCSSIFLYVSDVIGQYGLGYQLNNYILAVLLASYLNRSLMVLDPPIIDGESHSKFSSHSQFGCPLDDPNNNTFFQSGLGRVIDYPAWLHKGCSMPCIGEHNYSFWHSVAQSKESRRNEVSPDTEYWCMDEDGRNVSVLAIGGDLRHLLMSPKYNMFENLARKSPDWVSRIGATKHEAGWLANHSQNLSLDAIYDQISALLSRAGVVTFQPWINRDVHSFISRFDLPKPYVAFHVRRGDKLIAEAKYWVDDYWAKQGYNETTQPSNYIPFSHYLKQVQNEQESGVLTNVYIATDDQDTIKHEIDELLGFSNVSFHMNPDASSTIHLQSDMECSKRYNRTIAAIADLTILSQSDIFVGEYNSNWGRLVHTARTSFVDGEIGTARQFDMRIAFGHESRGIPGT
ncbi:hypothetical protein ACHAWT_008612 [Skeletonema menzelii]|mmetsp:Transcript_22297/g.36664  ORF Transcript_22297/g.36664 Transcript_22297/m.36664 type:complete len:482 (-) Transcript_22297:456-1901(-)|eukprot:scaffold19179_cov149-Skeletonema_menzelii.AAC.14